MMPRMGGRGKDLMKVRNCRRLAWQKQYWLDTNGELLHTHTHQQKEVVLEVPDTSQNKSLRKVQEWSSLQESLESLVEKDSRCR